MEAWATPTQIDKKGNVRDPGHIQLRLTPEEQAQHSNLSPVLGHSPNPMGKSMLVPEKGTTSEGAGYNVVGKFTSAQPLGKDKPIPDDAPGLMKKDIGPLTEQGAANWEKMQNTPISRTYNTSGSHGDSCATSMKKITDNTHPGQNLIENPLPGGTTPQGAFNALKGDVIKSETSHSGG